MAISLSTRRSKTSTHPHPAAPDVLSQAQQVAASATAEAEQTAQERAGVMERQDLIARRLASIRAERSDLEREQGQLDMCIADALALTDLGLEEHDTTAETLQVRSIASRLQDLAADERRYEAVLADLQDRNTLLLEREQEARARAAQAPVAALRDAKARHVRAIKQARLAYLLALREAGRFNGEHSLERPDDTPRPATWVGAIDRGADELEAGAAMADALLHRTNRLNALPTDWLDRLAAEVGSDE